MGGRLPPESVAGMDRNQWPASAGIGGRIRPEYAEGNFNAAYVGDWSIRSGATADVVYARLSPHLILACVEGKTLVEAIAEDPGTDAYKVAARISPDSNVRKAA